MDNAEFNYIQTNRPSLMYEKFLEYNSYRKKLKFRPVKIIELHKKINMVVYTFTDTSTSSEHKIGISKLIYTNANIYILQTLVSLNFGMGLILLTEFMLLKR